MATTTPTAWSDEVRANTTTTQGQGDPKIIGLADGGYYVVWMDQFGSSTNQNHIYGQRYDVLGNAVDGEAHIGPALPANSISLLDVDLAQLSGGRLAVVYGDTRYIYAAVSDASLGNFTNIVVHTNSAGLFISTDPSITALSGDAYEVTWTQEATGGQAGFDIAGERLNGATADGGYLIGNTTDYDRSETATLAGGNFVVVYQQDASGNFERNIGFSIRTPAGVSVIGGGVVGATSGTDEAYPTIAALTGGGFVVVWEDGASGSVDVRATVYDSAGADVVQASDLLVNTSTTGNQSATAVTGLKDGGFLVAWNDAQTALVRAQRFDAAGTKVGDEFTLGNGLSQATLNGSSAGRISLTTLEDGRVAVAHHKLVQDTGDIFVSVWDPRETTINGTSGDDDMTARHESSAVNGLGGTDRIYGLEGDDTLDGGSGLDTLRGGDGDDTYLLSSVTGAVIANRHYDTVVEDADHGTDTVMVTGVAKGPSYTMTANVENGEVVGTVRLTLRGNAEANQLTGHGHGHLTGMEGDDTYVVSAGDTVDETGGDGTDTVESDGSFSLADAAMAIGDIEALILTGAAAGDLTGNGLANTLLGNGAANTLDGQGGADTMKGAAGDDTYVVDDGSDVADEAGGAGSDTVKSSVNFSLADAAHAKGAFEALVLTGTAAKGTGNGAANSLTGNAADNQLSGGSGNDTLSGADGDDSLLGGKGSDALAGGAGADDLEGGGKADTLDGGTGADRLVGGRGADVLTAGSGDAKDVFAFLSKHDSGHGKASSGWDGIFGFDAHKGHEKVYDRIDLSALDADKHQKGDQDFRFVDHFSKADGKEPDGEVMVQDAGKNVKVLVDVNGDKDADLIILVMHVHELHKADFLL